MREASSSLLYDYLAPSFRWAADPTMDFNSFLDMDSPFGKGTFDDPIFTRPAPGLPFGGSTPSRWQAHGNGDLWPSDADYRLPESWSQTIDTLLLQSIDGHPGIGHSSSDTNESASGDAAVLFASTRSSTFQSARTISQPESAWQAPALSNSPSDPFNLLPTHPKTSTIPAPAGLPRLPSDGPPNFASPQSSIPHQNRATCPPTRSTQPVARAESQIPPSIRRLFDSIPAPPKSNPADPQPQFVAPADLSLARVPLRMPQPTVAAAPAAHSALLRGTPGEGGLQLPPGRASKVGSRGLSGWKPEGHTDNPVALPGLKPPCPRPSSVRLPPELDASPFPFPPPRTRKANYSTVDLAGSDDGGDEEDDSDVYQPSSSPARSESGSRETSPFTLAYPKFYSPASKSGPSGRNSRRGKGKAKGSAALALAVVTQMSKVHEQDHAHGDHMPDLIDDEDDELEIHLRGVKPGRKRKNSTIPLPIPVPHLIKKSRGRKVPHTPHELSEANVNSSSSEVSSSFAHSTDDSHSVAGSSTPASAPTTSRTPITTAAAAGPVRPTRGTRGKKAITPYSLADGGKRTYMCHIPGCGKCFVRGEHLKRHIRSIHTYDKPHPCPYNGCDKSFSRRDNLGQHVRIHLQA